VGAAPLQVPQVVRCNGACGTEVEVWANYHIDPARYECGGCQLARTEARQAGVVVLRPQAAKAAPPRWAPPPRATSQGPDQQDMLQAMRDTYA
jgi:hypothetical protein